MARAREKRFRTHPNRWGQGKVHRYVYDSLNRVWYCLCVTPGPFPRYHGEVVDEKEEVTCKKCLRRN